MSSDSFSSTIAVTNSNLTRLSKVVGSTAQSMVSSPYGDLSRTHYHEAMSDITRRPQFQKRIFSFSKRAPSEVVRSSMSRQQDIQYRVLTSIPDEMLHDLPSSGSKFSLFQGFEAIREDGEMTAARASANGGDTETSLKAIKNSSCKDDGVESNPRLRNLRTPAQVKSMTPKQLRREKHQLDHRLDLLEVRKELAANEIQEIDERISNLKNMRSIVFDRVADLEKEELQLEQLLDQVNRQIEDGGAEDGVEKYKEEDGPDQVEPGQDEDEDLDKDQDVNSDTSIIQSSSSSVVNVSINDKSDQGTSLLSASIYDKLGSAQQHTKNRQRKLHRHNTSRRKTMPTLQQYYEPGNNISVLDAYQESITQLDFDIPFGTLVSGSLDPVVKVWDLSKNEQIGSLVGHKASVKCLQMDDNLVVTGSADATAKVWDISDLDNPLVESLEAHIGEITALHFSENTLVTGAEDKTIRQWDLQTGRCIQALDVLWAAAQTATGVYLDNPSAHPSYSSPITDSWKRAEKDTAANSCSFVGALQCFDAALASGTADGIVRLWDLRSGQVHRTLLGHTGPVTCLHFDEVHLATGSLDRSIRIWDLRTGTISDAFAYENPITSIHFDARRIVSTNQENTVKIYDRESGKHWSCGPGEEDENASIVNYACYNEGYMVEGRQDGKIGSWAC